MFTSPYPDVDIPDLSIFDYLFGDIEDTDLDRVAVVDGATGAATSYRTLIGQINRIAGALAARGVAPGTVVGLLCPNIPAFASVFHGILRAGGSVTTINSLYTPEEIQRQLEDSGAELLLTVSPLLGGARSAAQAAGIDDERLIVLDGAAGHPSLADLLARERMPRASRSTRPATLPCSRIPPARRAGRRACGSATAISWPMCSRRAT